MLNTIRTPFVYIDKPWILINRNGEYWNSRNVKETE